MFTGFCLPRFCNDDLVAAKIEAALKVVGVPLDVLYINSNT